MGRFLKWLAIAVTALILLLAVTAAALFILIDPNDYRDDIAVLVEERTGRDLHIEGDIRLSVFPWLGIELGRVTLSDAAGFYDAPFVEIGGVQAAVRLWPLLTGNIETRLVAVDEPVVRLMVDEEGRANWEELLERLAAEPRDEDEERPPKPAGELPEILQEAVVAGIRIRGGALHWRDNSTGTSLRVEPFNLDADSIRLGAPISVRADLRAAGEGLPDVTAEMDADVELDRQMERLRVHRLELSAEGHGEAIPGGRQAARLSGRGEIHLGDIVTVAWPHLEVHAAGVTLSAEADVVLGEEITAEAAWRLEPFNLKTTLGLLDFTVPVTDDPDALTHLRGEGRLHIDGERMEVSGLDVELDESRLTGNFLLEEPAGPSIAFDLELDKIDVDRYLPPEEPAAPPAEPGAEAGGLPDLEAIAIDFPLEPLRELKLQGALRIGEARAAGLRVRSFEAAMAGADGRLQADPVRADLYEGAMNASLALDARGDWPYFRVDYRLHDVRFAPLLEDLLEGDALLDGSGRFELRGEGGGANVHDLLHDFRGDAELRVSEGSIRGLNIPHLMGTAVARVRGERVPEEPAEGERTDFAGLSATIRFRDGVARNDDLSVESPLLRVTGEGEADILQELVDYRLRVSLVETLEGQDGKPVEELRGVTIPIDVTGDLLAPSFRLDLAAALGEERMRQLREGEEAIRERLEQERQSLEEERDRLEEEARQRAEDEAQERLEERARDLVPRLR